MVDPAILIQEYAFILVLDRPTQLITAASENAERHGWGPAQELIGTHLHDHFTDDTIADILESCGAEPGLVKLHRPEDRGAETLQVVVHHFAEELVLEIEITRNWPHPDDYSARLHSFTRELEDTPTIQVLMQRLCEGVFYHFGCERSLILQFDKQYNGLVTHEKRVSELPEFLGIHFTNEDVGPATRYDQLLESVHNFSDVEAPLYTVIGSYGPAAREILRRHVACRGPSENFVQFLQDNEMRCIGSIALVVDHELYGALYYHHRQPILLDFQMRAFLAVAGRIAQQKLAYHIYSRNLRLRQAANVIRDRLQDHIVNSENLIEGLTGGPTTVIDLIEDTHGVAICSNHSLTLVGTTPTQQQIGGIIEWMKEEHGDEEIYHTDRLSLLFTDAPSISKLAAGILFLPLDVDANQWIVWFKPEVVQTITYGSAATDEPEGENQRRFYIHNDTRYGYSLPWTSDDIGTALALQVFIQNVVMQRYATTRRSNDLLREAYKDLEAFSYTVGHDLRAPLRGIASFAEILEEDFSDRLGAEGLGHLKIIQQNAERMRLFMTDLLSLSRIDRTRMIVNELSVPELVARVLADRATSEHNKFECRVIEPLPLIHGDHNHLLTVFTNLLSNAIKYSSERERPYIEVGHSGDHIDGAPVFYVADNGIGIPEDQYQRVFDLFARSGNATNFSGTGIGLSLVQRILRFHGGKIWIESEVGAGTKFLFTTGTA